jgi:hypothetical protein
MPCLWGLMLPEDIRRNVFLVLRDQEAAGSNPAAPTTIIPGFVRIPVDIINR